MSAPLPEPVVECNEIQGDILAGFRKDHVRLIFITVADAAIPAFKVWLRSLADKIAYADVVLDFNAAFSTARRRLQTDPPMQATWLNVAITGKGAQRLLPQEQWAQLESTFLDGPLADAKTVGEPEEGLPEGPQTWLIGAKGNEPDAMLIIAADALADVDAAVQLHSKTLAQLSNSASDVSLHIEEGKTRASLPGHEHFGFKDGISQPGVRGRVGTDMGPFVTRRVLDPADPLSTRFAAPGQPLCWPGEFVLGYERKREASIDWKDTVTDPSTSLTRNGSYLVYRKLRQDVPAFLSAAKMMAEQLGENPSFGPRSAEFAAAALVGRWPSGAPLARSVLSDDIPLGKDSFASNNFFYSKASRAPKYQPELGLPPDQFPQASVDGFGNICPFAAHIRKVNPRDQPTADQGSSERTLEHRILRRGIPYGDDYDPALPQSASVDRGLQFLCYQSSITRGFQFLMNQWANSEQFPLGRGHDIVIGQNGNEPRHVTMRAPNNSEVTVNFPVRFVKTTGAAYLFSPSRTALINHFGV